MQSQVSESGRGRGRGRGRGGNGKAQRARGRRGFGKAAQFSTRLLLPGEGPEPSERNEEEEQEARELAQRFARRELGSNADRYEEPESEAPGENCCNIE